jgi:hypothetical protein
MLNNQKIHPELAFLHSGMFLDPEGAYLQSKQWWEEKQMEALEREVQSDDKKGTDPEGTGAEGDRTGGNDPGTDPEE